MFISLYRKGAISAIIGVALMVYGIAGHGTMLLVGAALIVWGGLRLGRSRSGVPNDNRESFSGR